MADSVSSGASAPTVLDASKIADTSSSLWDRITSWAADNKSTVYTLAGVTLVVTSAGAIYYLSSSTPSDEASAEKRKARKEKKKAKKDVEKGEKSTPEKEATTGKPTFAYVVVNPTDTASETTYSHCRSGRRAPTSHRR